MKMNITMEKESTSCLNKMSILTFSYPILLRSMSTTRLMKDRIPYWDINEVNGAKKYSLALSLHNTQIEILNWVWISA